MKTKKKTRVLKLYLDKTFEECKKPYEVGKIKDDKNEIFFSPECVFIERKRQNPLKAKRKIILYVEGTRKALRFKETPDPEDLMKKQKVLEDPNPFWTMRESAEFVDKQISSSLEEHKPLTWTQFLILAVPVVLVLFICLMGFSNLGAL